MVTVVEAPWTCLRLALDSAKCSVLGLATFYPGEMFFEPITKDSVWVTQSRNKVTFLRHPAHTDCNPHKFR
jgi:hypothetical protein